MRMLLILSMILSFAPYAKAQFPGSSGGFDRAPRMDNRNFNPQQRILPNGITPEGPHVRRGVPSGGGRLYTPLPDDMGRAPRDLPSILLPRLAPVVRLDRSFHPQKAPRPENWFYDVKREWRPKWLRPEIIIVPMIVQKLDWLEEGWWQCTAVRYEDGHTLGYPGGGRTLEDAQYSAILACGDDNPGYEATECYIPLGYCREF